MKILKSGNNPFKKRCKRCGCEFVYDNTDVLFIYDEWTQAANKSYVNCPECGLEVPAKRMPSTMPDEQEHMDV